MVGKGILLVLITVGFGKQNFLLGSRCSYGKCIKMLSLTGKHEK
jgi:hypothetical protein